MGFVESAVPLYEAPIPLPFLLLPPLLGACLSDHALATPSHALPHCYPVLPLDSWSVGLLMYKSHSEEVSLNLEYRNGPYSNK